VKFLADENFRGALVRGLLRRRPTLDLLRVPDVGLSGADDPDILDWAARDGRVVLTHDAATLIGIAYQRLAAGLAMSGIIEVRQEAAAGQVIDDLLLIADASHEGEWEGQVLYLPLR